MQKTINIGLVGYKFMGKAHSNAYKRVGMFFDTSARVSCKAICGRDEEWVRQSAGKFGWEGYETDWRELVARPDIDVVDIVTPSNFHKEIALAAAEHGKHILCEKPLALNVTDAREMLAAVKKAGVINQIGFNYRFAPAIRLAKKMIDEGKLGIIYHFNGQYLQDFLLDPSFPLAWRLDKKVAGSGSLGDLGAHCIDLARYLVGEFKTVSGMAKTFFKERPIVERMEGLSGKAGEGSAAGPVTVDDGTVFTAEFACGALGCFEATRYAAGHKNALIMEINGSKGSLRFELERFNELQYFSRDDDEGLQGFRTIGVTESVHPYMEHWWPAGHIIGYEHTFVHEIYEFLECIALDKPANPDFYDGYKCSQVLEAVDASVANRGWVEVDCI